MSRGTHPTHPRIATIIGNGALRRRRRAATRRLHAYIPHVVSSAAGLEEHTGLGGWWFPATDHDHETAVILMRLEERRPHTTHSAAALQCRADCTATEKGGENIGRLIR